MKTDKAGRVDLDIDIATDSSPQRGDIRTTNEETAASRRSANLRTPTSLGAQATRDITGALNTLVADFFALYVKTKNFHWHVSGPHFRDYHLLLDEQATQIFATIDPMAERVRKLGSHTLRSIGDIAGLQRIEDSDTAEIAAKGMLSELLKDSRRLVNVRRGG